MLNNLELDEKAKELEDTMTPYALARRVSELEDKERDCIREFVEKNIPLLDDKGLDEVLHHCEYNLQCERKRIHGLAGL